MTIKKKIVKLINFNCIFELCNLYFFMKKVIFLLPLSIIFSALIGCGTKESSTSGTNIVSLQEVNEKLDSIDANLFENISGKSGLIIVIDDLGVFKSNSQEILAENTSISNTFNETLASINKKYKPRAKIEEAIKKVFATQQREFTFLEDTATNDIAKLASNNMLDDIIKIQVKSGIAQSMDNKEINKNLAGQTYIYLTVFDGKTGQVKFQETIGGTQFVDEQSNETLENKIAKAIISSLDQSIQSIENKI